MLVLPNKAIEPNDGKVEFLETQSSQKSGGSGEEKVPHLPGGL